MADYHLGSHKGTQLSQRAADSHAPGCRSKRGFVGRPNDRRNFIKRAMAVTGATWIGPSGPAILIAFEAREGLSASNLQHLKNQLAARQTTGRLVQRHNQTAYEWYAAGWGRGWPHCTPSMAKSLVSGMSLVGELNDGRKRPGQFRARDFGVYACRLL